MKKLQIAFFALVLLFSFSSCEKLETINVDFDGSEFSAIVPETNVIGTYDLADQISATNISTTLESKGIDTERIENVSISSLKLRVISGNADFNFSHIDNITISIGADGLSNTEIVNHDFGSASTRNVEISVNSENLKSYLTKDNVTYKVSISNNTGIDEELTIGVTPKYAMKAKIFK